MRTGSSWHYKELSTSCRRLAGDCLDINDLIKGLNSDNTVKDLIDAVESQGQAEGMDAKDVNAIVGELGEYLKHPPIIKPDNPLPVIPNIPIEKGVVCNVCGLETVMKMPVSRKPCLVCGHVN